MTESFITLLIKQFPQMLSQETEFRCDDGWYRLISHFCSDVLTLCDNSQVTPPTVAIFKEKFGCWRTRLEHNDESRKLFSAIFDIMVDYETRSYRICEKCGNNNGLLHESNESLLIKTMCTECAKLHNFHKASDILMEAVAPRSIAKTK